MIQVQMVVLWSGAIIFNDGKIHFNRTDVFDFKYDGTIEDYVDSFNQVKSDAYISLCDDWNMEYSTVDLHTFTVLKSVETPIVGEFKQ